LVNEVEKKERNGACPSLPMDGRPATVGALYPAMKPLSPRVYGVVLSTVVQHQMKPEKMILPLAGQKITVEPPRYPDFSTLTESYVAGLADDRALLDAGPQVSGTRWARRPLYKRTARTT
jgi:hypothetical protein